MFWFHKNNVLDLREKDIVVYSQENVRTLGDKYSRFKKTDILNKTKE